MRQFSINFLPTQQLLTILPLSTTVFLIIPTTDIIRGDQHQPKVPPRVIQDIPTHPRIQASILHSRTSRRIGNNQEDRPISSLIHH